uniref:Selenoprotein O n=1 Tax=Salmo trutta TaxID=8032 RepID=A0A674DDP5_SALTR
GRLCILISQAPTFQQRRAEKTFLRSSIREFLCSEAMVALGIPTTRAASLVASELYVNRDPLNNGRRRSERCSVDLRIAPPSLGERFGSFEIFHPGRHDIRAHHGNRKERNTAFFKEVWPTLKRPIQREVPVTLYDNCTTLCISTHDKYEIVTYYQYEQRYQMDIANIQKRFSSTVHKLYRVNTFHLKVHTVTKLHSFVDLLCGAPLCPHLSFYLSLDSLYAHNQLDMVLSMAQTNPAMFGLVADRPEVAHQLEKMGRLKELLSTNQDELKAKQRENWLLWISQYRKWLVKECDGAREVCTIEEERIRVMDSTNPPVVLRNYIAQNNTCLQLRVQPQLTKHRNTND